MSGGTYAAPPADRGRSARARALLLGRTALCGALAVAGIAPGIAGAEPQGTVVVGGAVDIRQSGTHTEFTQASNTALLNHRSFDIRTGESVNFAQPSAGALAVNRVVGSDLPTSIAGRLTANGNVWVLNPSGVAIKGGAQVNVGGLLATTASISDEAILAGERSFAGAPVGSAVTNAGTITAGQGGVVLVAPVVSNSGTIATRGGDVALGAGAGFTVDIDGDGLTRFEVAPGSGVSLTNAGTVRAEGGAAYISAASAEAVRTAVVSIGGRVEATRVEQRGGVIYVWGGDAGVTEVGGALNAAQAQGDGGRIAVTGDRVDIRSGAFIDASGAVGGGRVEIGGGYQGAPVASPVLAAAGAPTSAPLPTARRAVVRQGSRIAANAGAGGDGGTVIVWADEATSFRGAIEARGGAAAGDGGFAEVSGRGGLAFAGAVDLSAPAGDAGMLLLDPDSVTIVAGGAGSATEDAALDDRLIVPGDMPAAFTISAGAVAASVAAADTVIHATGSITQQAALTLSGDESLTYRTESGDITLEGSLTGAGNALIIDAGDDVALGDLSIAALDVTAGGSIAQGSGSLAISGAAQLSAGGAVTLGQMTAGTLDVAANGSIGQNAGATVGVTGSVRFDAGGSVTLGQLSAGTVDVIADGAIGQSAGTAVSAAGTARLDAGAGVTLGQLTANALQVTADSSVSQDAAAAVGVAGAARLESGGGVTLGQFAAASLDVAAAGTITQFPSASVEVSGTARFVAESNVALDALANDFATVDLIGGTVSVTDRNAIRLGQVAADALTIVARGAIADTDGMTIEVRGATDLSAEDGGVFFDIALDGVDADPLDRPHNFATVTARGEDLLLVDANAIALGSVAARAADGVAGNGNDGDLTVLAGGAISQLAGTAIVAPGDGVIRTAAGGIALANVNDFADEGSGHALALQAPGDVGIADADSLALGASSGQNLALSAFDLAIVGPITFNGTIALTNSAGDRVVLGSGAADADGGTFEIGDAGIAQLQAQHVLVSTGAGGIEIQGMTLETEALTLDAGGGAGPVVFSTAATVVAGDLSVTGASISQDAGAPLVVYGGTDLSAPGGVTLANASNDFDADATSDAVDEVDASGATVTLFDRSAIALGAIDTAALEVRAGGSITDTPGKAVEVAGTTDLSALAAADAFDIQLDNAGGADRHQLLGAIRASGEDITILNNAGTTLGAVTTLDDASTPGATADPTINEGSDGDLTVVSDGPIVDVPGEALTVAGNTFLQASTGADFHDVGLGNGAHDFSETDPLNVEAEDILLTDRDGVQLGQVTARAADGAGGVADQTLNPGRNDGALAVTAGGAITDTVGSAITVPGATTLIAANATRAFDIALDEPALHDFGGVVTALGEDIILNDGSAIILGAIDANAGSPSEPSLENPIAFYDDNGDGALDASEPLAAGDLTVRAGGTITDTGAPIDVQGRTRLEAVAGTTRFDISLDGAGGPGPHDFDSNAPDDAVHEVDAIGRSVTLADVDAIGLGDVSVTDDLSIAAAGSVTDTPGEAILVGDDTTIVALAPGTADAGDNFFDIALDNIGLHDFASVDLIGEGISLVDRRDLSIVRVLSLGDGMADPTLGADGIFLQVGQGDFAFETGPGSVPVSALRDAALSAPNGSFETSAAIEGKDLPDGLTFFSQTGDIIFDLQDGFVVKDVEGTPPFTLDAPNGVSRIRIGEGTEREFFGVGTADFLEQAQLSGFNPLFDLSTIGDLDLVRVTGDFALVARSALTVRFQNTIGTANEGAGTTILGTSYLGGVFDGISFFGSFSQAEGVTAALRGFRDAAEIGDIAFVTDEANTVNGCTILVPSACQPLGSLLPALGQQDGLLLGLRFVAPTQDLDDPFTNRGDEEEWE